MASEEADNSSVTTYYVKLTGAPQDATEDDVRHFLNDCHLHEIVFDADEKGCLNGVVVVRLGTQDDLSKAIQKDQHQMRWKQIQVYSAVKGDFDQVKSKEWNVSSVSEVKPPPSQLHPSPNNTDNPSANNENQGHVVRLRGLPWAATASEIASLLCDVNIKNGEQGIHFTFGSDGRASGEAFVEVCTAEDVGKALGHNREHLGGRYIEIFKAYQAQLDWECRVTERVTGEGGVVRLRGLPYGCSDEDVRDFFSGLTIPAGGITRQHSETGRETGEAFVEFLHHSDAERALEKNRQRMGHRYIEVFRSTHAEIRPMVDRSTWHSYSRHSPYSVPGDRGGFRGGRGGFYRGSGYERQYRGGGRGRGGHVGYLEQDIGAYDGGYGTESSGAGGMVSYPSLNRPPQQPERNDFVGGGGGGDQSRFVIRMRGLPYSATETDIMEFFSPLVTPSRVFVEFDNFGRPSGGAEVLFASHEDALTAMKKDRAHMGSRYIELFMESKPDFGGASGAGGGGYQSYVDPYSGYSAPPTGQQPPHMDSRMHQDPRAPNQPPPRGNYSHFHNQSGGVGAASTGYGAGGASTGYGSGQGHYAGGNGNQQGYNPPPGQQTYSQQGYSQPQQYTQQQQNRGSYGSYGTGGQGQPSIQQQSSGSWY